MSGLLRFARNDGSDSFFAVCSNGATGNSPPFARVFPRAVRAAVVTAADLVSAAQTIYDFLAGENGAGAGERALPPDRAPLVDLEQTFIGLGRKIDVRQGHDGARASSAIAAKVA